MKDKITEYGVTRFDARTMEQKIADFLSKKDVALFIFLSPVLSMFLFNYINVFNSFIFIFLYFYLLWYRVRDIGLEIKYPTQVKGLKHHKECAKADGIMFLGNHKKKGKPDDREVWISNSDARTHILFLGTTGSGKTEGLKLISTNALTWASGFVYVDGKADTELWASLYSLARRFGREDDLLLLNYMTGNSDDGGKSNSMNPFSNGSASYLTNLLVGLMDEAGGDNAMWKGRAISLMTAIMPALTWKRDHQALLLDVDTIRNTLTLDKIVALSRDKKLPKKISAGVYGYLDTLPGYVDSAFDDNGKEKPQGPDDPPHDLSTCYQQHGFLSMQFTRSLGSLADEYGYIFKQNLADIDINDVVLNRRMMVVLIPILEKSGDEAANLGKIVSSSIKGMMGATLGSDIEGNWEDIIENKVTKSNSPFITIFDEVGYYTSQGMAAMAAQARSLGFSLVFAGQDLAAMEKRVKEEAKSITANCNLKIFGKLEDPGPTKEFFEKNIGKMDVLSQGNFELKQGMFGSKIAKKEGLSIANVAVVTYDDLRKQGAGHVHMIWAAKVSEVQMPWIQPPKAKAIRIQNLLKVKPGVSEEFKNNFEFSEQIMEKYRDKNWSAKNDPSAMSMAKNEFIDEVKELFVKANEKGKKGTEAATMVMASLFDESAEDLKIGNDENLDDFSKFFSEDELKNKNKSKGLMNDLEDDDFKKMLDSFKSDKTVSKDFNDKPPFDNFVKELNEKEDKIEEKERLFAPTISLTNTLPWEEDNKSISDDVVHKALDEIWGREIVKSKLVNPDEKKEMSGDFVKSMKKYLKPEDMSRESIVNAVLRATADIISNNMKEDSGEAVEAIKSMADTISEKKEDNKVEKETKEKTTLVKEDNKAEEIKADISADKPEQNNDSDNVKKTEEKEGSSIELKEVNKEEDKKSNSSNDDDFSEFFN